MPTEHQLRSRAGQLGLRLVHYRETSRWFHQYGPYALIDTATNGIVHRALAADDVAEILG